MRIERRAQVSRTMQLGAPFIALAFTLLISSVLVAWAGAPVGRAYALLLEGGFGSGFAWSETLTRATPLILTGLAAAVAFKARLFNIGAEGQLYAGALAAVDHECGRARPRDGETMVCSHGRRRADGGDRGRGSSRARSPALTRYGIPASELTRHDRAAAAAS